jgi:hypothetical protein
MILLNRTPQVGWPKRLPHGAMPLRYTLAVLVKPPEVRQLACEVLSREVATGGFPAWA